MIISSITFSKFRNFRDEITLEFSKDSKKINVVYGLNGEGKTTMHQLFRWTFYGKCNFDPARSGDKGAKDWDLYNVHDAKELQEGKHVIVRSKCMFSHLGTEYTLSRAAFYKKQHGKMIFEKEKLDLLYKTDDKRLVPIHTPQETINEILPSVFSKYFFFDGERMVNDLRDGKSQTGTTLSDAIYYLFDLKEYKDAINDIGEKNKTSTVIGKLDNEIVEGAGDKTELTKLTWKKVEDSKKIEEIEKNKITAERNLEETLKEISRLSEIIGSSKGSKDLENERKTLLANNEIFKKDLEKYKASFAKHIYSIYPRVMVANRSLSVKDEILKVLDKNSDFVPGLTKKIVENLIERQKCICGTTLTNKEIEYLKDLFNLLPPKSFQSCYHEYLDQCKKDANIYSEQCFVADQILDDYSEKVQNIDKNILRIETIDSTMNEFAEIDSYIQERIKKEKDCNSLRKEIENYNGIIKEKQLYINAYEKKIKKIKAAFESYSLIENKIEIIEAVKQYLQITLNNKLKDCRNTLQENIEKLITYILTSHRKVQIGSDFNLTITNLLGGTYQNEGTFAVVSFSYILGLLQTLKKYNEDAQKKYALLLDAPFSKLDIVHKPRVVDKLLDYGDQIILFSKDSLLDCLPQKNTGMVYTLESVAADQTVTNVRKSNAKEVEYYFSDEHVQEIEKRKKKV